MYSSHNISNLTDDCLIKIFIHCNTRSLGRLACTCKRFNFIIKHEASVWIPKSRRVLGSNLNSPNMIQRSLPVLTPIERCKVSRNWVLGIHERTTVMRYVTCLPWMCMEEDCLYVSKGTRVVKFFRNSGGHIEGPRINSGILHEDDISKFAVNGDNIFSVGWDGRICVYKKSSLQCISKHRIHKREINAIDSKKDLVITGARDGTIKVWRFDSVTDSGIKGGVYNTDDRVLSLSLLPSTKLFIAGLPGTKGIHPLPIFDVENKKILTHLGDDFLHGAGIIDIYPESDNLVLTCGYDTTIKLWDVRTPKKCVSQWVEPYDNILYTLKSDDSVTLVAGANRSGFFHVWDKRARVVIQTHHNSEYNSPVYCLTFDASHVYSALNRAVVQDCFLPEIR